MADTTARLTEALSDRYAVERELGRGGMATVYLARDLKHDRFVAVKVLHAELAATLGVERFLREIRIAAQLSHPHILMLIDSGEAAGFLYYVMPYVEGESLRDRLQREKQLPLDDAIQIAREVASALSYAHSHDVVHRDIKPENILFQGGHAVVADFGIARAVSTAGGDQLTETGLAVGTPTYMSPEQAGGERQIDGRSDIYSLGCVLYEMLGGDPPYTASTPQALLARKAVEPIPSLRVVRDTVPKTLERVVAKSLAKLPADRYSTATDLADALERAMRAAEEAPAAAPRVEPARRTVKFWWWFVGAAAALVIAVAGGRWALTTSGRATVEYRRFAVLPLENLTGDSGQEYLVSGIHEAIIGNLMRIEALSVIAHGSVMRYKGSHEPTTEIARVLNVDALVTGSVSRDADRVGVKVALIDGTTGLGLWSRDFKDDVADVVELERDIARAISDEMDVATTTEDELRLARPRTVSWDAHEAYLKGRRSWQEANEPSLRKSIEYYEQAIALDPEFARAYAGLADAHLVLAHIGQPPHIAFPAARANAEKALQLDEGLAEAHAALADTYFHYYWDWEAGERSFLQAIELNPGYTTARWWYSGLLSALGRHREAIEQIRSAQADDALSIANRAFGVRILYFAREYDLAIEEVKNLIDLNPGILPGWFGFAGLAFEGRMELQELDTVLRQAAQRPGGGGLYARVTLAQNLAAVGRLNEARETLDFLAALSEERYVPPHLLALASVAVNDREQAFDWLEKAFEAKDAALIWLNVDPGFDPLRDDPRFANMVRRLGLEP